MLDKAKYYLNLLYPWIVMIVCSSWIFLYRQLGMIARGDFLFPINLGDWVYRRFFLWQDWSFLGYASNSGTYNLIFYTPIYLLNKIGLSLEFIEKLFFFSIFLLGAVSMYILLKEIISDFKWKRFVCLIASIFYIFNPYIIQLKLIGYTRSIIIYSIIPLLFYLFYKYLKTKNYFNNKYLYLFGIALLICLLGGTLFPYGTWFLGIVGFYFAFLLFFKKNNKRIIFKFILASLVYFLINAFWIIPPLINSSATLGHVEQVQNITNLGSIKVSSGQSLTDTLRFLGMWGFRSGWKDNLYFPYYHIFDSLVFIFIGYSFLVIVMFGLLIYKKNEKDNFWFYYFTSLFLVSIFFIGGTMFLFPEAKLWLYKNFPFLLVYRKPYEKIGFFLIFSFVGIFALSLKNITLFLKKKSGQYADKIVVGFLITILLTINIYNFPFWTKQIFQSSTFNGVEFSGRVYYPQYYYELKEFSKKQKLLGTSLGLPVTNCLISSSVEVYKWGYGTTDHIIHFINGYILLNQSVPFYKNFFNNLNSNLTSKENYVNNLKVFAKLFNMKTIILRNDTLWQFYDSPDPSKDKKYLENNFEKEVTLGELDIYKISSDNFSPIIYTAKDIIINFSAINSLPKIISQPDYENRSVIYFEEQNKNVSKDILNKIKQYNFKKVIVSEAKIDKIERLNEEIKSTKDILSNLETLSLDKLSKKDKIQLEKLQEEQQILEQKKIELQISPVQYFAKIEEVGNYNFSFQLSSCQEWKNILLNSRPLIILNGVDYEIPFESISIKESEEYVEKYKIKIDDDCFVNIKDIELSQGELKIATNYIMDLDNLVFSKYYLKDVKTPVLEFKKVNPIKYIIRVHQAKDSFPLVFSKSFHSRWKVYLTSLSNFKFSIFNFQKNFNDQLLNYKILDGNTDDQASIEELGELIRKGRVSTLGDGKEKDIKHKKFENGNEKIDYIEKYKIDFISKNFQDTIQNDNLLGGHFFETYFKKPLPEENHLMVNGYANAWWLDINEIKKSGNYIENSDGSIDFELVVEFWPQRLFYIGLGISGITLAGCLNYLVFYYWRKKRKKKVIKLRNL